MPILQNEQKIYKKETLIIYISVFLLMKTKRSSYREAAKVFLDLSEITSGQLINTIECAFIGAYCYAIQQPVTVYNISKLPFVGCYRTAKRYCDLLVEAGALEYTENGAIAITEKGNETSDFFFKALFEMPSLVGNAGLGKNILIGSNRQSTKLINKTLNDEGAGE